MRESDLSLSSPGHYHHWSARVLHRGLLSNNENYAERASNDQWHVGCQVRRVCLCVCVCVCVCECVGKCTYVGGYVRWRVHVCVYVGYVGMCV